MNTPGDARAAPAGPALASRHAPVAVAFGLGALAVLGFAPFSIFPLAPATLAVLLVMSARFPRHAPAAAFAYGLGLFLFGVSWVYVSLHDFGAMPAPLAALATLVFCAFLALFPALAVYAPVRIRIAPAFALVALFPAAWTLLEWTRGWIFTGFPWLAYGYSQIAASPLAGYAPLLGIYGVTLIVAMTAGLCALMWNRYRSRERWMPWALLLLALWSGGWALRQVPWTRPEGEPVTISLLQGNVPQDLKFRPERIEKTLDEYRALATSSTSRLIVFPETALPIFLDNVPQSYLTALAAHARQNGGDMLIGVPLRLPDGRYFNSVISVGASAPQSYQKFHLVPFGEFIPLRPLLGPIVGALAIPLQDFSRGTAQPQPLEVAGQRVAVNVCYEDAFGEEIIRQLPQATLLANVSNVAWFGHSIAPSQHLQISQARALETGRYMVRATNTGVTAVIDPRGAVVARAEQYTRAVVNHRITGYQGATPYVRWGNLPLIVICAALLASALLFGRHRSTAR
jgi:apolipoprotein N-acyltransferase